MRRRIQGNAFLTDLTRILLSHAASAVYGRSMIIDIVSDTICPWCFIGKRRLERAIAEQPPQEELQIGWRPFQLNPDIPPGGMDRKQYLEWKFGGSEGAKQVYDAITAAGQTVGIAFDFGKIPQTPNTINSHRLIRRAAEAGQQDAMVEALFRAYFLEGGDIEGTESLVAIAAEAGMNDPDLPAWLESDAEAETVRAEDAMARQIGIQGVPFFIIDRKYAISGAQEPAVFHKAFEMAAQDPGEAEGAPEGPPAQA